MPGRQQGHQLFLDGLMPGQCRQVVGAQLGFARVVATELRVGVRREIGMSQGEMALLIGASRPKVNIALTTLEDMGAISRKGQGYTCDTTILQDVAGMD